VDFSYIWGDALPELDRMAPDLRIINLETSVTNSEDFWREKGINYRMSPENFPCISAAGIDYCSLSNNHVLDWGYQGLEDTLAVLRRAGVGFSGAGCNTEEARSPAILTVAGKGRVVINSFGTESSGIPLRWAAGKDRPGVNLLQDLTLDTARQIGNDISSYKKQGDIVALSIHWGGNWGYPIPDNHIRFAHNLIDYAGVDLIHGHSSHHFKSVEIYRNKLILYGCGDFLNDYEGISGYELFRGDLGLMYFAEIDPRTGNLISLQMTPTRIRNMRVNRAGPEDIKWMEEVLDRECKKFGPGVILNENGMLVLK